MVRDRESRLTWINPPRLLNPKPRLRPNNNNLLKPLPPLRLNPPRNNPSLLRHRQRRLRLPERGPRITCLRPRGLLWTNRGREVELGLVQVQVRVPRPGWEQGRVREREPDRERGCQLV